MFPPRLEKSHLKAILQNKFLRIATCSSCLTTVLVQGLNTLACSCKCKANLHKFAYVEAVVSDNDPFTNIVYTPVEDLVPTLVNEIMRLRALIRDGEVGSSTYNESVEVERWNESSLIYREESI